MFEAPQLQPVDHPVVPLDEHLLHIVKEVLLGDGLPAFLAESAKEDERDFVIEATLEVLF